MAYFTYKFFSWYLSNKYSLIVLLFGISFSIIALTSFVALTLDLYHLALKPTLIHPTTEVVFPSYDEGSSVYVLRKAYDYVDLFSFVIIWGASVLLLHEFMPRWHLRHWILVFIPLVYYISAVIDDFGIFTPSDTELLPYYLYISLNSTAGGLLFGFAFLIVARHIQNDIFKGYMIISAIGFVLLFISGQVTLVAEFVSSIWCDNYYFLWFVFLPHIARILLFCNFSFTRCCASQIHQKIGNGQIEVAWWHRQG